MNNNNILKNFLRNVGQKSRVKVNNFIYGDKELHNKFHDCMDRNWSGTECEKLEHTHRSLLHSGHHAHSGHSISRENFAISNSEKEDQDMAEKFANDETSNDETSNDETTTTTTTTQSPLSGSGSYFDHHSKHHAIEDFTTNISNNSIKNKILNLNLLLKALLFTSLLYVLSSKDTHKYFYVKIFKKLSYEKGIYLSMLIFFIIYYLVTLYL